MTGGVVRTLPAPLDEIPLLVRAGAMLVLLPADVDTLADYGAGTAVVRLATATARSTCWRSRASARRDVSSTTGAGARRSRRVAGSFRHAPSDARPGRSKRRSEACRLRSRRAPSR
jgi:alpha-glucosidase (family GH31 glycosyl hydrolase)